MTTKTFQCDFCSNPFERDSKYKTRSLKRTGLLFCSYSCHNNYRITNGRINTNCGNCKKSISKRAEKSNIGGIYFCSRSCSTTYHNLHKTTGNRVSKFELDLREFIIGEFPGMEFIPNDKTTIGMELDIYFPHNLMAIEINGIYHYKPIHGIQKLQRIIKLDKLRAKRCKENNISLLVLDISHITKYSKDKILPYLDEVKRFIFTNNGNIWNRTKFQTDDG